MGPEPEWAGLLDRLDLMHCMLGHPELPLHVKVGGKLHEIADFEYSAERDAVILLVRAA